jgi:hypothetical protein
MLVCSLVRTPQLTQATHCGVEQVAKVKGELTPRNPLFKILWDGVNPFSNKIVLMDEVHNLVAPAPHLLKNVHCRRALQRLRHLLASATNCVVVRAPLLTSLYPTLRPNQAGALLEHRV